MLALTRCKADGWLLSLGYVGLDPMPELNRRIDEAAQTAGRPPSAVRRLLNVSRRFGTGTGFLEGGSRTGRSSWPELTLTQGMSTYIVMGDDAEVLRRVGGEVGPAVRELVDAARGS